MIGGREKLLTSLSSFSPLSFLYLILWFSIYFPLPLSSSHSFSLFPSHLFFSFFSILLSICLFSHSSSSFFCYPFLFHTSLFSLSFLLSFLPTLLSLLSFLLSHLSPLSLYLTFKISQSSFSFSVFNKLPTLLPSISYHFFLTLSLSLSLSLSLLSLSLSLSLWVDTLLLNNS